MYYYNNSNNSEYNNTTNEDNNSSPLFSQSFDPSSVHNNMNEQDLYLSYPLFDNNNMLNDILNDNNNNPLWDMTNMPQQQQQQEQDRILLSDPNFLRQHQLLQEQQFRLYQESPVSDLSAILKQEPEGEEQVKKPKKSIKTKQDEIDHLQRFNELQARFRVNVAGRKTSNAYAKSLPNNNKKQTIKQEELSPRPVSIPIPIQQHHHSSDNLPRNNTPPVTMPTHPIIINNTTSVRGEEELSIKPHSLPTRTIPIQIQKISRQNSLQPFDAESHQRELDHQLDKVDFNDITVSELKEMLRQRGKPATGKKAVLLQRLLEEKDNSSSKKQNRHSQPLPIIKNTNSSSSSIRPRSFQSTGSNHSPVMMSSSPTFLPGSPSTSLNRSIANMHIGSPPATSRRYSPYSPRSPKPTHQDFNPSSSLPSSSSETNDLGSGLNLLLSSSYNNNNNNTTRLPPNRYYNIPKTYKPFTSSALATPDREEDVNPFDAYYNDPIKEEEDPVVMNMNFTGTSMDNNAFDFMLPQDDPLLDNSNSGQLTTEQIMMILNNQQQANAFDFKLDLK